MQRLAVRTDDDAVGTGCGGMDLRERLAGQGQRIVVQVAAIGQRAESRATHADAWENSRVGHRGRTAG
jgi:hypothetical protein